jgi:hypothetical protein
MFLEFIVFGVGSVHPVSGRCFPTPLRPHIYSVETTYGINSVISKLMTFVENAETGCDEPSE